MKSFINRLLAWLLCAITHSSHGAEDYAVYSTIYQWYGQLDLGNYAKTMMTGNAQLNHPEYADGKAARGAHHILNITELHRDKNKIQVKVNLEYQPWHADRKRVLGHYLEQIITLSSDSLKLLGSRTLLHQQDDFNSTYRASSDSNLIQALIYQWTHALDNPQHSSLAAYITHQAPFTAAQSNIKSVDKYLSSLAALEQQSSRRTIRNLQIKRDDSRQKFYRVDFEYQWTAVNKQGHTELAQVGLSLTVHIHDRRAMITGYREIYLPPVTDPGAEIRC